MGSVVCTIEVDTPLLKMLLLLLVSACHQTIEDNHIEDDVLRKFYTDMESEKDSPYTFYHPELSQHNTFGIEDYFEEKADVGQEDIDLSRISTEQIKNVLLAASAGSSSGLQFLEQTPSPVEQSETTPSSIIPQPSVEDSRDPTYILSRLLFHMSQLPE